MFASIATELVWKQSINQRNIIYLTVHKFMLKNLDNKVNSRLLLINWPLNHIIKFISGADLNDIEKLFF